MNRGYPCVETLNCRGACNQERKLLTVHVVAVGWDCKTVSCNAYEVVDRLN